MNTKTMYESLGISAEVFEFGEDILAKLEERFKKIDAVAEYNQGKVISAMQKNMVNATHFAASVSRHFHIRAHPSHGTALSF